MRIKDKLPFLFLILLHLLVLTQIKFTVWPEMILYPYLILNDFANYKDIVNPYFPFLTTVLSFYFQLFGISILNLKLFTWSLILITDLVIIYSSKNFYKEKSKQFIALLIFILLQIYYGGNGLWFELMLSPLVVLALTLVYFYTNNYKKIILAALFLSIAVLIKQNSVTFLLPIILLLFFKNIWNLISFTLSFILVISSALNLIFFANLWEDFYNWAIKLPSIFTRQPGFILMPAIRQYVLILFPLIPLTSFLLQKKYYILDKIFWSLSFLVALQFAFPRYENFHLQVVAALSGVFAPMLPKKYLVVFLIIVTVLFSTTLIKDFHKQDRFLDEEMIRLAEKINKYPSVYILNGSDLSYYFANKLPPKPWAINFPWYFEVNNFENRFIDSLKEQKTEYIVIGNPVGGDKYALGNYLPASLINYIKYNYVKIEKFEGYTIWQRKLSH